MKKIFALIISLFCLTAVFAEDWYVCLGSFTKKEYLDTYITALKKNKIPTFTQPYTDKKGVNWIRVFYDEGFKNADTARMIRDSLQPKKVFKDFKMDGLWICQTTKPGTETVKTTAKTTTKPAKIESKIEPKIKTPVEPKIETPVEPVVIEKTEKPVVEKKKANEKPVATIRNYTSSDLDAALPYINGYSLKLVKHYNFNLISKNSPYFTVGEEVFIEDIKEIADCMVTARYRKNYSTIDVNICFSEKGFPELSFDGLEKVTVNLPEIDSEVGYTMEDGNINTCYVLSKGNQIFYGISAKNTDKETLLSILNEIRGTKLVTKKAAVGSILETAPDMTKVMYTYTDEIDIEDSFIMYNPEWMAYCSGNWYEDSLIVDGFNYFYEIGIDSDDAEALFEEFLTSTDGQGTIKEINGKKVWYLGSSTTPQREAVFTKGSAFFMIITEASEEALLEEVSKR